MQQKYLKNDSIQSSTKYFVSMRQLIIITFLITISLAQCPQSCLTCLNSTACTSCLSQNNLILINTTLGCLPCPLKCQKCISQSTQTQCTTCSQGYYLDPYLQSCYRCQASNCIQCSQYFPKQCQYCQNNYFLQQSTATCKYCNTQYASSKTCKQNFILSCQDNYFTANGQICTKCDTNGGCKTCISTTLCSQCFDGFYLTNGKCLACDSSCKTCNTNTSCTSCPKSYRINTISKCQLCSTSNCASCTILDICQECISTYYLDNNNKTCVLLSLQKLVLNCIRYGNNYNYTITSLFATSSILCRTCTNETYLNLDTNSCQGCSLLCQTCNGMYRSSKCTSCNSIFGRLIDPTNGICGAKLFTQNGQKTVYRNNRNDANIYIRTGKLVNFTQSLLKCPGGQLAGSVSLSLNNIVGYQYSFYIKLLMQTSLLSPYNFTVFLNSYQINNLSITSSLQSCNDLKITNFSFSLKQQFINSIQTLIVYGIPNILTIKSTFPEDLILDIRQIVILVKQCHQTCALCDTYLNCLQCKNSSQLLQQQACVDKCSNTYFLNLINKQCLLQCPKGTYSSIQSIIWTCQICPIQCNSCVSQNICNSCATNFYLYQSQCLLICPETYFKNTLFNKCQKCVKPCYNCISTKQCLSCQLGFYFERNNSCLMECPQTFFGQMDNMTCKQCIGACYACNSEISCLSCTNISNLTYFNFQCLLTCPIQYFSRLNQLYQYSCQPCQFPCLKCKSTPQTCTQCISGFLLALNNTCVQSCPDSYFSSITFLSCILCQQPCENCINSEKMCISCIDGYLLMGNICVPNCGEGFYQFNGQLCLQCQYQCQKCQSKDNCTQCSDEYYLQNNSCLTDCFDGYYKGLTVSNQRICFKCNQKCKRCFGENNYCLECYNNFYLESDNSCSSLCQINQLYPGCSKCQYPCYSCSMKTTNCTSCVNTYYFSQFSNQCVAQCYLGYYKAIQKGFGLCKACIKPCINCENQFICHSCSWINGTSYYLQTMSAVKKICTTQCGLYEYKDQQNLICLPCVEPCLTCKNATYCLSCFNEILVNGNCISKIDGCPIGNFQISNIQTLPSGENITLITCASCPIHCSSCKSSTVCSGCVQDYYLFGNSCVDFCPSGSAPIKQLRKCIFCQYPCAQCQIISGNCTKCSQLLLNSSGVVCPNSRKFGIYCIKYYLLNGECMSQCPAATFSKNDKCVNCISPCSTCTSQTLCTSCRNSYYMLQNGCYSNCPDSYYGSNVTQQCQKCIYPCKTCINQQKCIQCLQGYLFQQTCLIKQACPLGYFEDFNQTMGKYCNRCDLSCIACMDLNQYCLQCSKFSIYQGHCYQNCPNGYYSQSQLSTYIPKLFVLKCQKCPIQCLTCSTPEICQSCVFSYSLLDKKCVSRCPPNYMEKYTQFNFSLQIFYTVSSCTICDYPCNTCFLQTYLCQSCLDGYLIYESKCLTSCSQGTYLNELTKSCKQCPFPCKYCEQKQKDIICLQCIKGYFVENNVCVDKCKQKFINFDGKKCVYNCDAGYMVEHILTGVNFCVKQCYLPYIKNDINKRCVVKCLQSEYIDAEYECKSYNSGIQGLIPKFKSHLYMDSMGLLTLYIQLSRGVQYTDTLPLDSTILIKVNKYEQNMIYRRLLQESSLSIIQQQIPFVIRHQSANIIIFSLYPLSSIYYPSYISLEFEQNGNLYIVDKVSKLPIQQYVVRIQLSSQQEYYEVYDYQMMYQSKFVLVGQIIMDFILILGIGMIVFNRYAKMYNLLIYGQSLFMIVCLNINNMPPNLYQFLQGFKYSHFYQFQISSNYNNLNDNNNDSSGLNNNNNGLNNKYVNSNSNEYKYTDFSELNNFNRIQSIFGDINFLTINSHLIIFYSIIIVLFLILYTLRFLPNFKNQYLTHIISLLKQKFNYIKWSYLTDIFISTFMLIIASFCFQLIHYSINTTYQSLSIALSYIFLLIFVSYGIYFIYKNYKMHILSQKQPQKFIQKGYMYKQQYVSFYQGISTPNNSYKNYMLVLKIIIYGGLTGLLWRYPSFCLSIWIVIQIIYGVIYLVYKPFADDIQNYLYSVCGFIYGFAMILVIVLANYKNPSQQYTHPSSYYQSMNQLSQQQIQSRKILIGYFIIVLLIISMFIYLVQMMISIMRGNLKPKKLDGQQQQYNEVRQNSPNNINNKLLNNNSIAKQNDNPLNKIKFEQKKRQYIGYEIQSFNVEIKGNNINNINNKNQNNRNTLNKNGNKNNNKNRNNDKQLLDNIKLE